MFRETEDWFVLKDGTKLYEKTWEPSDHPKAHLIFLHGFSDRSELHYHLFPTLASQPYNITCHAIDQRGWGKSVQHHSQRGLTGTTSQVLADINAYVDHVSQTKIQNRTNTPLVLMGHSMGGQQTLHYLLSPSPTLTSARSSLSGAIVEAPYIALDPASQPSTLLVWAGRLAAMVSPKSQMKQHLDERYITRDPAVNREWKEDVLCHDHGTLEGLRDMLQRGADLVALGAAARHSSNAAPKLSHDSPAEAKIEIQKSSGLTGVLPVPVFWAHGTHDRVTSFQASKAVFDALEDLANNTGNEIDSQDRTDRTSKTPGLMFKAYEQAYHKIHAEPDGVGVAFSRDVGDWILGIVGVRSTAQEGTSGDGDGEEERGNTPESKQVFVHSDVQPQVKLKAKL